jgi:cobalt-precorrin-5B (C1)-methyltransferase
MNELYVFKEGKRLRCGYTTGSCATAAAKGAAYMLVKGELIDGIEIDTPSGVRLELPILKPHIEEEYASCCVVKDAGDDPDVTDKLEIYARVSKRCDGEIHISGYRNNNPQRLLGRGWPGGNKPCSQKDDYKGAFGNLQGWL